MTPKISLVAVCCSNDSLSSWNSRTFSMAITPGRRRFRELDLRRGEGAHFGATCVQYSNEFPLLTKGAAKKVRKLPAEPNDWKFVLRADVGNVERAMLAHPAILWLINTDLDAVLRAWNQNEPAQP